MNIKIYYTKGCSKCRLTKQLLDSNNITEQLVTANDTELTNKFKMRGFQSFPVVQVTDENGLLIDEWNDFQTDKIAMYRQH